MYFDTSALIKLIFDEPGSARRRALGSRRSARLNPARHAEARAALAAARGAGRVDESTQGSAVATLEDLYAQLRTVAIDEPLAGDVGDLAAEHALRGYDAVHLACALHLVGDDILLATWDNALNAAARDGPAPG
jgi:predicted nucleic acid-binding protein